MSAGLMFWPVFMLFHRRWSPRARRLFIVFLVTLGFLASFATFAFGPWQAAEFPVMLIPLLLITNLVSLFVSSLVCKASQIVPLPRSIRWIGITLATIVFLPLGYARFILDWQGQPTCHKVLMVTFQEWMNDHKTKAFPNENGVGRDSLNELGQDYSDRELWQRYGYVAGLREDDPGDLVLMYVNCPTRWIWHGVAQTIFTKKAWIIVPVDFVHPTMERKITRPGECSETVSIDEFRKRLGRTIDFVRQNQRPNWEMVVAEQTKFLDSIEPDN